jgi:hypothetical protein
MISLNLGARSEGRRRSYLCNQGLFLIGQQSAGAALALLLTAYAAELANVVVVAADDDTITLLFARRPWLSAGAKTNPHSLADDHECGVKRFDSNGES